MWVYYFYTYGHIPSVLNRFSLVVWFGFHFSLTHKKQQKTKLSGPGSPFQIILFIMACTNCRKGRDHGPTVFGLGSLNVVLHTIRTQLLQTTFPVRYQPKFAELMPVIVYYSECCMLYYTVSNKETPSHAFPSPRPCHAWSAKTHQPLE